MAELGIISTNFNSFDHLNVLSSRNLGAALLAANLRNQGFQVDILNFYSNTWDEEKIIQFIKEKNYTLLGFSIIDLSGWNIAKKIISQLRKEGYKTHITLGGYFPTLYYQKIQQSLQESMINSICLGEGENTILSLAQRIQANQDWKDIDGIVYQENGQLIVNKGANISNLDKLAFAAADEIERIRSAGEPISIFSSRGCDSNCLYCTTKLFYESKGGSGTWRPRSVKSVIDELAYWVNSGSGNKFVFVDENFVGNRGLGYQRALEFCQELRKRDLQIEFSIECRPDAITDELASELASVGCRQIFLGIESGSNRQLKEMGKGLSKDQNRKALEILYKNNIDVVCGFIMFTPDCNIADLKENIDLLKFMAQNNNCSNYANGANYALPFRAFIPFEGTIMYDRLQMENRLIIDKSNVTGLADYIFADPQIELLKKILVEDQEIRNTLFYIGHQISKVKFEETAEKRKLWRQLDNNLLLILTEYLEETIKMIEEGSLKNYLSVRNKVMKNLIFTTAKGVKKLEL